MNRYVLNRLLLFIPTLIGASLAIFLMLRVIPGDVALLILAGPGGEGLANPESLVTLRHALGTDRPLHEQYVAWMWGLAHLDLGRSLVSSRSVADDILQRLPTTFELATFSIIGAAVLGVTQGMVMAVRRETWIDYVLRILTIGGLAIPTFFVATIFIFLLVRFVNWIPPLGFAGFFDDPAKNVQQVIWPVIIMSYSGAAVIARMTRASMLEILRQDYVVTARAKGLAERTITLIHALKNAMPPTAAFIGVTFVGSLNGVVVLEKIFLIPGIGSGLVDSISARDYPMIQGTLAALVLLVLTANLIVDLLHGWLDPRVSLG